MADPQGSDRASETSRRTLYGVLGSSPSGLRLKEAPILAPANGRVVAVRRDLPDYLADSGETDQLFWGQTDHVVW